MGRVVVSPHLFGHELSHIYNEITSGVLSFPIDYSHIVLIIAIWPGDRICRPEHSTVEHGSCDERV